MFAENCPAHLQGCAIWWMKLPVKWTVNSKLLLQHYEHWRKLQPMPKFFETKQII